MVSIVCSQCRFRKPWPLPLIFPQLTHSFVEIVAPKLHRRIRDNPYAVRAIPSHEALETFLGPHLPQRFPYAKFVLIAANGLNLEKDFEAFEW